MSRSARSSPRSLQPSATATQPRRAAMATRPGLLLADVQALQAIAHRRFAPDSTDPGVVRQRSRGKLTCRERIDLLLDAGSFREVGSLAGFADYDDDGRVAGFTPANHVGGWGKIDGRTVVVCADDFTSRGGHADGAIGGKSAHLDRLSIDLRCPSIRLLDGSSGGGSIAAMVPNTQKAGESSAQESSGAIVAGRPRVSGEGGSFLPGHLGSTMFVARLDRCRWSICCSAASWVSALPRPCWAISRSWCATSPSCSWPDRRWSGTRWVTTLRKRNWAAGISIAGTVRSIISRSRSKRQLR